MKRHPKKLLVLLFLLSIFLVYINVPEGYVLKIPWFGKTVEYTLHSPHIQFSLGGLTVDKKIKTHLGLDLSGGTHIVLEADVSKVPEADRLDSLEGAKGVIERRINFFGVDEPVVQTSYTNDSYRIIVELPGVTDVEQAVDTIGQTARLELREFSDPAAATGSGFTLESFLTAIPVGIDGADLSRAQLAFSPQTGAPEVAITFTNEGAKKFSEVTTRLVGRHLAIFLDDIPITWPRVSVPITDGQAVISGGFTKEDAKTLALQLQAGALPVPVHIVEKRTVGATLGQKSVEKSLQAGFIGLGIVAVFMVAKYGWLGVYANMALALYGLLSFALFRLIPVTLSLPGIAGFILSIGMAVDSNILIFSRYREERRAGRSHQTAMELAFGKAWDSIRDANITTIITCLILFNPANWNILPSSGLVRGFAVTLFLGVIVSLFTGLVATRTIIRALYHPKDTSHKKETAS